VISTRNFMPRGTTAISPGATSSLPSSVKSPIAPSCGTNMSSPSAFQNTRSFIERLAR
jgi:hypothetical protein